MSFHPLIESWFKETLGEPSPPQSAGWPLIADKKNVLIAAPTGSGKTLAAFLVFLDQLYKLQIQNKLENRVYIIYVSPLKALSNDIQKNLENPLVELSCRAREKCLPAPEINVAVRTGDTPAYQRQKMITHPPHILATTPESLHILITAEKSRKALQKAHVIIVDEIHAVLGEKRGAHLSLSLERLERLCGKHLQRIGLSATQKPIEKVGRYLVGVGRPVEIVDTGSRRNIKLAIEIMDDALSSITTHEYWAKVYQRIESLVKEHKTVIIFTHTRTLVERVAHYLGEKMGKENIAAHHGSLSKETRLHAEKRLKNGEIRAIVASASLELGIDVGYVDLTIQLGAPKLLSSMIQRVGRSGHFKGGIPKGVFFPLTRDELIQNAAAIWALQRDILDALVIPDAPLDIMAQIIVSEAACGEIEENALFELICKSAYYRHLSREKFTQVLEMLVNGIATSRGRKSAYLHHDKTGNKLIGRRGARLAAITSGGAIPETAEFDVIEEPSEQLVGRINEDFAIESAAGDIFLLGNKSWRIRRLEGNKVRVIDAQGTPPTIPFWLGEAPSRSIELSEAVSDLRKEIASRLDDPTLPDWLCRKTGVNAIGAEQMILYIRETVAALGTVPTHDTLILERFFDDAGGMQLVLHSPLGGRINRAWGMGMRKRFCLTFDFELQSAATDDGAIFSLGEQHSFPLESVWGYINAASLHEDLVHAILPTPLFTNRWRWNATRALGVLRFQSGKKVPIHFQRMRSDDVLASVFPAHAGCQDNRQGPIEPVDHPLVQETVENCLCEAMDYAGLLSVLHKIHHGEIKTLVADTSAPSPMSHELINTRPYAFLDDAPLEERRTRAVSLRHVDPSAMGKLDLKTIEDIKEQAWPDPRNHYELHDLLVNLVILPQSDTSAWQEFVEELVTSKRAGWIKWQCHEKSYRALVSSERFHLVRKLFSNLLESPDLMEFESKEEATGLFLCVRGWMEILGPVTVRELSQRLGIGEADIEIAMTELEKDGQVIRGKFTPGIESIQWCERTLLARIHRLTVAYLRKEIECVSPQEYMRFLFHWQHALPEKNLSGKSGLFEILEQLEGYEGSLETWEKHILPLRVREFDSADLDYLCLSGSVTWIKLPKKSHAYRASSLKKESAYKKKQQEKAPYRLRRNLPVTFLRRDALNSFLTGIHTEHASLSTQGRRMLRYMEEKGASFLADFKKDLRMLDSEVEETLRELVASGRVCGDGLGGIRYLMNTELKKRIRHARSRGLGRKYTLSGRWFLVSHPVNHEDRETALEQEARRLLCRWGVVLRELLEKESRRSSWWQLLMVFRRMEARGEIRGGRFVNGFPGEQFALPEAVDALRAVRKMKDPEEVLISSWDPLNLTGVLLPGEKIPAASGEMLFIQRGKLADHGLWGDLHSRLRSVSISHGYRPIGSMEYQSRRDNVKI